VIERLADRWLLLGWPIYLSQFVNEHGSQWERLLGWSRLISEDEVALSPELGFLKTQATVYRKHTYSCLVGPFLEDMRCSSWNDVVICGIATDSCVLATAIDLFEFSDRHIRPVVVQDGCASQAGKVAHDAGLFLLKRFIGAQQIITSDELLDEGSSTGVHDTLGAAS
jgi:nicotinamidase-related amidase